MSAPIPGSDPTQPTVYEMIRTVSRQLDQQAQATARLEGAVQSLVTQDQRRADMDLTNIRIGHVADEVRSVEERATWARRAAITALGAPLTVALVMYIGGAAVTFPPA
jgi:hypothetical protein